MHPRDDMPTKRFQLLQRLYGVAEGNETRGVDLFQLGCDLGFDRGVTISIGQYLRGERFIVYRGSGRSSGLLISLTPEGILEVKQALAHPEQPTKYFPPVNILSVGPRNLTEDGHRKPLFVDGGMAHEL